MIDLKEERKKAGLTQQELADKVPTVRTTISNIECGLSKPSIATAQEIARVLGFSWTEFFTE